VNPPGEPTADVPRYEYKEYPKTLPRDDFWGQVRRTKFGMPVSDADVQIIVETIISRLNLGQNDVLLDLACGNGALSQNLFSSCQAFLGVDFSDYLIEVAKDNFEQLPEHEFRLQDVAEYTWEEPDPLRFTKALCYASLQYLARDQVARVLEGLHDRFKNVVTVLLGNLPDKDRAHLFYPPGHDYASELSDPLSQIGMWWAPDEMQAFATTYGWRMQTRRMSEDVFNSNYRYDAILTRSE
jgi:cyclopropane fatty-acyl-phospholipid synthase-like methyltransferase